MKLTLKKSGTFRFLDGTLKDDARRLVVWWYGPVVKNNQANTVPKACIFFRTLDDQNNLGGFVRRQAALTHLGLLRIGSVWQEGASNSCLLYEEMELDVDFSEGGWRIISLGDLRKCGYSLYADFIRSPYLPEEHGQKTFLIDFYLPDGKHLFVPCLEFFARCYGRSSEVKRVLATYRWESVKERLFKPLDAPPAPGRWPVKSTRRMHKDDVILLAHILYDPYAEMAAKSIYAQLEADFSAGHPYSLPKIIPWFQGEGKLLVEGVSIGDGNSFLALRILGSTQPGGEIIHREREKFTKKDGGEGGDGVVGKSSERQPGSSEIVDLTDDVEPDHGSSWMDIPEQSFRVLGEPRKVIDNKKTRESVSNRPRIPVQGSETTFSSGDAYGSGKGVGKAFIHAPLEMESHGALQDMWEAFHELRRSYPGRIESIKWFTFEHGFSPSSNPKMIQINPVEDEGGVKSGVKMWPFLDYKQGKLRGALVIRILVDGGFVYVVEIQRTLKKEGVGSDKLVEVGMSGLCFYLDDDSKFEPWIRQLLSEVRYKEGSFKELTGACPGYAEAFMHRHSKYDEFLYESAAKNALSKARVKF